MHTHPLDRAVAAAEDTVLFEAMTKGFGGLQWRHQGRSIEPRASGR
jgi:hypothetical protein